jgi:hypothetical protein
MDLQTTTTYTIEQLDGVSVWNDDVRRYLYDVAPKLSEMFDGALNWENTPYALLADKLIFLICRRNGEIRGHMIANLYTSPLDIKVKILYQVSFHVKPDSGRAAYHLFQKFIDIGKDRANHIITMLTTHSNIKPATLERYGFKELETLYRMEIK